MSEMKRMWARLEKLGNYPDTQPKDIIHVWPEPCPDCGGLGYYKSYDEQCFECNGSGIQRYPEDGNDDGQ